MSIPNLVITMIYHLFEFVKFVFIQIRIYLILAENQFTFFLLGITFYALRITSRFSRLRRDRSGSRARPSIGQSGTIRNCKPKSVLHITSVKFPSTSNLDRITLFRRMYSSSSYHPVIITCASNANRFVIFHSDARLHHFFSAP